MRMLLSLSLIAMLCGVGHADPQSTAPTPISAAARPYFQRGAAHYEAGEYAEAIEAFENGRRLDPHPDFLYALAQAYRKTGDCTRAIALYQSFLATHPPDEEAARARANVERCPLNPAPAAQAPEAAPRTSQTPESSIPPHNESPWYTDVTGGVLAAAGAIGIGVGATYLVMGDHKIRDANHAATLGDYERLGSAGSHDRQIGGWCMAAGSALLVGAIVRYALHGRGGRASRSAVRITPGTGAALVSLGGSF